VERARFPELALTYSSILVALLAVVVADPGDERHQRCRRRLVGAETIGEAAHRPVTLEGEQVGLPCVHSGFAASRRQQQLLPSALTSRRCRHTPCWKSLLVTGAASASAGRRRRARNRWEAHPPVLLKTTVVYWGR
jgi:hypothetical protein